jgi:hypothetical protein
MPSQSSPQLERGEFISGNGLTTTFFAHFTKFTKGSRRFPWQELAALLLQKGMEEERGVWGRVMGLHTGLHDLVLIGAPIKNDEV